MDIEGKQYTTAPHTVTLKCIDIANEDVESNLGNVKNDTGDSNPGDLAIDGTKNTDVDSNLDESAEGGDKAVLR